ncbi:MAG: amidohydrolase [Anaerolineae bacterium]|nr:amidohydrolase [Anaerolineae bacterium]
MIERAHTIAEQLVAWRRDFHMHPELSFQETRTAARVAEVAKGLGYRVRTGVGRTGVVAERGSGHPIVALRADMDALPIQEENDVPYASQVLGVMHACGHDAHTAIALGVATLLAQEAFPGTVRFLFQPAEEKEDAEGLSGAPRMIEDGAMDGVSRVLALHLETGILVGDVGIQIGPASAGVDTFYATLVGRGGHGARPHEVIDPIHIAGHVILALHAVVSRRLRPLDPGVVSIGTINGGQVDNVIPERVMLSGTLRYLTPDVQATIHAEVERALSVARALGGDYELRIDRGYPPMFNHVEATDLLRQVAGDLLGTEHVLFPRPTMGAEDFGYFSAMVPGALFRLGCQAPGDPRQAHSPRFDFDERCLPIGVAIMAEAALRLLKEKM